MMYGTNVHFIQ